MIVLRNYGGIFDVDAKKERINLLEKETSNTNFWNDNEKAQIVLKKIKELKDWTDRWDSLYTRLEELMMMADMAQDEGEESTLNDLLKDLATIKEDLESLELMRMLGGVDDAKSALVTIHPGAGGTESQDWAEMLFRMYLRYAQRSGFDVQIMDQQTGDEAGIKSATIEVNGKYAFGYLKAEAGVHRLVRISPFDANKRRHTSFASVFVYPEVDDDIEIEINPSDLRIDTYRASGAGGQHVNKTSSAVRITHIPTNIVVQCQNERSQFQNKANAMKMLMARLYQKQKEEDAKKMEAIEKKKKEISWGSQIRSYVFHPYNMVKDHRTSVETSNVQDVMDGNLSTFIKAYLLEFND